jgi:spermidine synthase
VNLRVLFFISFVLAFCSIGYEFAIARTLTEMTGRGSQSQALTVAFYILGLGIGARMAKTTGQQILAKFIWVELLLACAGIFSISLIQIVHLISYVNFVQDIYFLFAAQIVSLGVGVISGFELPYLLVLTRNTKQEKPTLFVLGLNYFGSMVAAVICNYLLFPRFSGNQIVFLLGVINIFAALVLLSLYREEKQKFQISIAAIAFVMALFAKFLPLLDRTYLQYYYSMQIQVDAFPSLLDRIRTLNESVGVERIRTPYQVLDFVKRRFPDVTNGQLSYRWGDYLYINGQLQIQIGNESAYHELMAHTPLALTGKTPKNILILGGGDGLLAEQLLRQTAVEKITIVELDKEMIRAATERDDLAVANSHVFQNPKVKVQIQDAYIFVRLDKKKYDAIYIDLPFPFDEDLNKLYSVEFYTNVRKRTTPEAFITIDFPLQKGPEVRNIIFQTLRASGFAQIVGYGDRNTFILAGIDSVRIGNNPDHPLLSERNRKYNKLHSDMFTSTTLEPEFANSALHPLLIGQ